MVGVAGSTLSRIGLNNFEFPETENTASPERKPCQISRIAPEAVEEAVGIRAGVCLRKTAKDPKDYYYYYFLLSFLFCEAVLQ